MNWEACKQQRWPSWGCGSSQRRQQFPGQLRTQERWRQGGGLSAPERRRPRLPAVCAAQQAPRCARCRRHHGAAAGGQRRRAPGLAARCARCALGHAAGGDGELPLVVGVVGLEAGGEYAACRLGSKVCMAGAESLMMLPAVEATHCRGGAGCLAAVLRASTPHPTPTPKHPTPATCGRRRCQAEVECAASWC